MGVVVWTALVLLLSAGSVAAEDLFGTPPPLELRLGGTGNNTFTAQTCVRVNSAGTAFESAGADCGTGSGSATPGGSDGQVQYNDGGTLGGDSGMSYNDATNTLSVDHLDTDDVSVDTLHADQLASILGPVPVTLTGTTAISGRVVTGTGTAFLTEVRPGDVLYTSNVSNTGIVLNVWSNTELLIARAIGDGSGLTTKILRSPLAVGADYPSHCGIGEDAETDANASTTLDICAGSEDCDSTTICIPSYTFHVGDVIALDSAPSTYARVTAVDDTLKQITVDTALGNGSESQAIRIRRLGFVVTALGDLIAGANDGSVLPIRPESSGYEGGYTDFMFFAGKPRLQTRSASFIETGDPPDLTLGRIGDGPYPIAVATSVPATQAGSRVGDFQWKGWRGDRLTAPLVIMRGRAVENFSNTAQGMKWEVLTTPAGTITPLRYLVLEDSGDMTLACSNTDGGTCPGTAPRFRLSEAQANGSDYVGLKAPASLSASWDLTLPADDGNASDCLKSDGSGVTSWGSCVGTATTPTPAAHQFYAGPTSGAAGAAVWRTIVQSDLPFPATITPVPTWTPGVTATPVPTITPFACGTAYAVQQVTNGTPVCVLLPTPDGNGAAPVPTLTPHNLLDGQMHRDTIAGTPCAGCDIAARGTAWGVRTPGPTWTPVLTATPVPSMTPVPTITPPWTLAQEYQLAAGEVLAGKSGGGTVATVVPTGMVVHAGNGVFKAYATITPVPTWTPGLTATPVPSFTPYVTPTPILTATPVASMTPVPTITPPWTLAQLYQLAAGQVFVGKSGDTTVATAVPTGMLVHDGNGVFKAYATVTPVPTWTPGLTATPVPSMTPVPSITPPWTAAQIATGDDFDWTGKHSWSQRVRLIPTTLPASTPPGAIYVANDHAGPPIYGTPTATVTFTPGGGVATVTPTPTATFTAGGGAATPTPTVTASPTPTITATPIDRIRYQDTTGQRTVAAINDLLDLRQNGVLAQNGVDIASINLDAADFATPVCSGAPPVCTLALASTVMRSSTTVLTSQMPTIAKADDQDLCWGTDSDFCIRWVSASAWATFTGLVELSGNLQLKKETNHSIVVPNSTSTNTSGGSITIQAGNGAGLSNGGNITLTAGSGLGQGNITLNPSGFDAGSITLNNTTNGPIAFNPEKAATLWQGRRSTSNAAGVTTTLQSGGATSGATDKAAGDLILDTGLSTGTGKSRVRVRTATTGLSSGTADNAMQDRFWVQAAKSITDNSATAVVDIGIASGESFAIQFTFGVTAMDGTDRQVRTGMLWLAGVNKAGTMTCSMADQALSGTVTEADTLGVLSAGTMTLAWAFNTGTNECQLTVNANTSLTPSTGYPRIAWTINQNSSFAATVDPQ